MGNQIVKILFCPQFEPFQPYLSLPYLKSLLNSYEIESSYYDANIDFYWWLLENDSFMDCIPSQKNEFFKENLKTAIKNLTNGTDNMSMYRWSINIIEEYFTFISLDDFKISLSGIEVKNKYSSDDLKQYVYNENNLFYSFFEKYKHGILGVPETNYYFFSIVILDQLAASLSIARKIKTIYPSAKIVFGGPVVTRLHEILFNIKWINDIVDFIEPGEGYRIIPRIFNLNYEYTGHVSPNFEDFNLNRYLSPYIVLPYLIAHGCSWGKCTFCSHHLSYEGFRSSDINDVINDILKIKKKYKIEYISFCDEHLNYKQLNELSEKIISHEINIKWSTFVRAEKKFVDHEFSKKLYNSGCRLLFFGFETISQRLLNVMKKGNNSSYYLPILKSCKNANIAVRLDMMFGFPTETYEEAMQTLEFIKNNKTVIDTPFSSVPVSEFELRKNIPVFNELDSFSIDPISLSRGDLDEQYDFIYKDGSSNYSPKGKWRDDTIRYMKNEMEAETYCPFNKTHQLIYKSLYDIGKIKLPISSFAFEYPTKYELKFINGIYLHEDTNALLLDNIPTGSQVKISKELKELLNEIFEGIILEDIFKMYCEEFEYSVLYKLLNFLIRNDFILINEVSFNSKISSM